MKAAKIVFVYNGKESKEYHYQIEEHLAKSLAVNEFAIVESAKNIYGIGIFKGVTELKDPEQIRVVTKAVVQDTDLYYKPQTNEEALEELKDLF